jgi:hypothetical protein
MGKIILDPQTIAKLRGVGELLELYDENGQLLGYCLPPKAFAALSMPIQPPFSEAEVANAFQQTGTGRPLADILAELRRE